VRLRTGHTVGRPDSIFLEDHMLRFTRVCVATLALALSMPGVARAIPITIELTGSVLDPGDFGLISAGAPITATLRYDTTAPSVANAFGHTFYDAFTFELRIYSALVWPGGHGLAVADDGSGFGINNGDPDTAIFFLRGPNVVAPGGGLPTAINFAGAIDARQFEVFGPPGTEMLIGVIDSVTVTQGSGTDPILMPEPATLTLSAFGLAALVARRRRLRTPIQWEMGHGRPCRDGRASTGVRGHRRD
jgi:PEP-CTERM motif